MTNENWFVIAAIHLTRFTGEKQRCRITLSTPLSSIFTLQYQLKWGILRFYQKNSTVGIEGRIFMARENAG
jgi:hypothetical protein